MFFFKDGFDIKADMPFKKSYQSNHQVGWLVGWFFYGISTFIYYLMPNSVYICLTKYFQMYALWKMFLISRISIVCRGMLDIGIMVRVFANGPRDMDSIPARVLPKTQKMVLDATLLNTQHY